MNMKALMVYFSIQFTHRYETPEDAKRRMAAEGNHKLDDVLPIYRKKATTLSAGGGPPKDASRNSGTASGPSAHVEKPIKYFVVDGVEALSKFGADAWYGLSLTSVPTC